MYLNEDLLHNDTDFPKQHLKSLLLNAIENMEKEQDSNTLTKEDSIATVSCINAFISNYDELKKIYYSLSDLTYDSSLLYILKDYYEEFLHENIDLYSEYFQKKKYSFDDDEYKSIQDVLDKLRKELVSSDFFEKDHKQRILEKLESLQKELHKKMSSLDKSLGKLVSIATAIGAAGEKSKPMFDRVNETIKSLLRVQNKGDNVTNPEKQIYNTPTEKIENIVEADII